MTDDNPLNPMVQYVTKDEPRTTCTIAFNGFIRLLEDAKENLQVNTLGQVSNKPVELVVVLGVMDKTDSIVREMRMESSVDEVYYPIGARLRCIKSRRQFFGETVAPAAVLGDA